MKQYLVNSIPKMVLSTKLLLIIHHNKIALQNIRNKYLKCEFHVDKFRSTSKLRGEGDFNFQLRT
jgi:hypothetical protein